jgi:ribonuclease HI
MFMCQHAFAVWHIIKRCFGFKVLFQYYISVKHWLFDFLDAASEEEATIFTVTLWHIWEARNVARNGEHEMHPQIIVEKVKAYVEMILMYIFKPSTNHMCESKNFIAKWTPPPDGWLMANVDAATFKDQSGIGMGVVIRDHFGRLVSSFCQKMHIQADPELAEALAVRFAIVRAKDLKLQRVIVASDCLNVVNKIKASGINRSLVGPIVQDIRNLARESSFAFIHVPKGCNEAAHVLAKLAHQNAGSVW